MAESLASDLAIARLIQRLGQSKRRSALRTVSDDDETPPYQVKQPSQTDQTDPPDGPSRER